MRLDLIIISPLIFSRFSSGLCWSICPTKVSLLFAEVASSHGSVITQISTLPTSPCGRAISVPTKKQQEMVWWERSHSNQHHICFSCFCSFSVWQPVSTFWRVRLFVCLFLCVCVVLLFFFCFVFLVGSGRMLLNSVFLFYSLWWVFLYSFHKTLEHLRLCFYIRIYVFSKAVIQMSRDCERVKDCDSFGMIIFNIPMNYFRSSGQMVQK